ncbi:hypothetical protein [Burkholderia sp. BE17]|uniref:hypothetical protein n=1 Tax=Burkholderia sp. BE17 TaxID=2656644 RepID=UPI00128C267D|nr:hypothetical protein [Burkholderia sp. BE17]MPV70242.1 hypothetical protein [Burkholderia sp. BE17]
MDQTDYVLRLATRVRQAILKRDFNALGRLSLEVHDVVSGMATGQALSIVELDALRRLTIAHGAAISLLKIESERLIEAMNDLNDRRAGWAAYAAQGGTQ